MGTDECCVYMRNFVEFAVFDSVDTLCVNWKADFMKEA